MPVRLSVKQRSEFVATFRWIEVTLMETLAGWIASTPEMEVKVLFGRHVWDCAQHADLLGKRCFELRAPLHFTLEPVTSYRNFIEVSSKATSTEARIGNFYDAILPGLLIKYQRYLIDTDLLVDEPTVRIIHTILDDIQRMQDERIKLREELTGVMPVVDVVKDSFDHFVCHRVDSSKRENEKATI